VRLSANFSEFKIRSSVRSGELVKVHPFFMGHPVYTCISWSHVSVDVEDCE